MKRRITAFIVAILLVLPQVVFADEALVSLDPFKNELFEVSGEIPFMEYIAREHENLNYTKRDSKYIYNDGLFKRKYQYLVNEVIDGQTVSTPYDVYGLYDMNGNLVYSNVDAQLSGNGYTFEYNLGYVVERIATHNKSTEKLEYNVTFIDLSTGERYSFDKMDCSMIYNDGSLKFEFGGKYYRANLKKPALITTYIDGNKIYYDQVPIIQNGRTLVPVRAIFEAIGATVYWDGDTRTVTAKKDGITVSMVIDDVNATKNGQMVVIDVPAQIANGRTLVPARFAAECFDLDVEWNGDMKKVLLNTK